MPGIFKRTITMLLVLIFLLSAFSVSPAAAECTDKPEAVSFSFLNADSSANISATCYYSDEFFYQSGMKPDTHLRTLSLCMAMAAFESFREGEDYRNRCENIEAFFLEMGFSNLFHNEAYDQKPSQDSIGIAIGSKTIDVFGVEYTLLAVGIRGASYGAEWANNMLVGESGHATGFSSAAGQVLACIRDYEAAYGILDHAKIWISGFSRAGAVANLTAEAVNRLPLDYATTKDDIYCYTFEAPQGADKTVIGQYPNIHNTVSAADLVPLLPLAQWGLTRVGYLQEGQEDPYSLDDLLLPSPGSEEYDLNLDTMLGHMAEINPALGYYIDDFSEFRFNIRNFSSNEKATLSDFVHEFSRWINATLPDQSRASYAANYEGSFVSFSRILLSTPSEETSVALKQMVKDPAFYGLIISTVLVIQTRNFRETEAYESSLKEHGSKLGEKLVRHLEDAQITLSEEDAQSLIESVYPIIHFLDAAIEDDVKNYGGYHLATLLSNLFPLLQAHCPETILAWLETYDSYFTPERFTPHQLEFKEEQAATCTQNGHTAYWICDNCEIVYTDADASEKITLQSTVLPATGHHWNNGIVTRKPTEKRPGERTYICLNCGEIRTEEIERLPITPKITETPTPAVTEAADMPEGSNDALVKHGLTTGMILIIVWSSILFGVILLLIILYLVKNHHNKRGQV